MTEQDFPALYRDADFLSLKSQKHFFRALKIHLYVLVIGATLSIFNSDYGWIPILQSIILLLALGCSIYLFTQRPDRYWYAGRALAESIKTLTWRYVCRAEPFQGDDGLAKTEFRNKLKQIYEQNKDVCQKLTGNIGEVQCTEKMDEIRKLSLDKRVDFYRKNRIKNQLSWYKKKADFNKYRANLFFLLLIATNAIAIILSLFKIKYYDLVFPIDVMIAIAGGILSWIQAKRFTELSASYALTAHEISLINEQSEQFDNDQDFSVFVGDAENAFSREHTQWVARRDV